MFNRGRGEGDLEKSLRARRAEASPELVQSLTDRVRRETFRPRRAWSRLAYAAAIAVFCLGTFASFGGLSYAASGAAQTYDTVKHAVAKQKLTVSVHRSSAADEYKTTPTKPAVTPKHHHHQGAVAAAVATPSSGTLPFTGFSLLGTVLVSAGLIGAGAALRRRERRTD